MKSTHPLFRGRSLLLLLLGTAFALFAANCGKKGTPLPPIVVAPVPPEGVRVRQVGDLLVFSFPLPTMSTDGKTPVDFKKIEIYRMKDPRVLMEAQTQTAPQTQPQTQTAPHTQTAPQTQMQPQTVPQAQTHPQTQSQTAPQTQAVQTQTAPQTHPAAQTQTAPQTQTQTQTAPHTQTAPQTQTHPQTQSQTAPAHPEEAREVEEEEFKSRSEKIAEIEGDLIDAYIREGYFYYTEKISTQSGSEDMQNWFYYSTRIYNKKGKCAGFSKPAGMYPTVVPKAPANFTALLSPGQITLNWTPVTEDVNGQQLPEGSVSYVIFRGSSADFAPETPLSSEPSTTTTYTDTSFQYGQPYYYFVRAVHAQHKKAQQGAPSNVVLMFPQDTFAPRPPEELNVVAAKEGMVLIWAPNQEEDVAGYNIFRSAEPGKDYVKINKALVRETTFTDTNIQRRQKYYYVVTAVDNAPVPNESGYSTEVSETAKPQ